MAPHHPPSLEEVECFRCGEKMSRRNLPRHNTIHKGKQVKCKLIVPKGQCTILGMFPGSTKAVVIETEVSNSAEIISNPKVVELENKLHNVNLNSDKEDLNDIFEKGLILNGSNENKASNVILYDKECIDSEKINESKTTGIDVVEGMKNDIKELKNCLGEFMKNLSEKCLE